MANGKTGIGAYLTLGGTKVGLIKNISGPTQTRETIDTTNFDSGGFREYIAGLKDSGTVSFDVVYNPLSAAALETNYASDDAVATEIVMPKFSKKLVFNSFVTSLGWEIPLDDAVMRSCELQVTGNVALSASS